MSVFDEKIKRTEREIEKLLSDIEKKKARIAELRLSKKDFEAKRQRDNTYSDSFLQVLADGEITSDEQRNEVLLHLKEYIASRDLQNADDTVSAGSSDTEQDEITEAEEMTVSTTAVYQDPHILTASHTHNL